MQFLPANQTVTQTYAVTLTDSYGATDTENVTITLHGVNDAPVITSNGGDIQFFSIPENTTAVTTIAVFDADVGDTRTWSLEGVDASKFDISNTGVITFKTAPDIESPSDSGGNWTYDLIAKVTDSAGLFDRQQLVVYLIDRDDAPSGANNNIQITEDVTYTFSAADFGFSDVDGDQFAGVVVNTSPDSAHGYLLRGGFAVNAGDTISAAEIAAGMLTYHPVDDRFNGQSSFDFSVRDTGASGDGNLNTDQSPNTMRMTFTGGNQADHEGSGIPNFDITFAPSVLYGFQSFRDPYIAFQATSISSCGISSVAARSIRWTCRAPRTICRFPSTPRSSAAIPATACSRSTINTNPALPAIPLRSRDVVQPADAVRVVPVERYIQS